MSHYRKNIEEFVREKLGLLDGDTQPDWASFEAKLRRAIWRQRMRRAAGIGSFVLLLFLSQTLIRGDWTKPEQQEATLPILKAQAAPPEQEQSLAQVARPVITSSKSEQQSGKRLSAKSLNRLPKGNQASSLLPIDREAFSPINFASVSAAEPWIKASQDAAFADLAPSATALKAPHFRHRKLLEIMAEENKYEPYISPLQEKKPWTYSLNIYPNFAFREFRIDPSKRALLHSDFVDAMQRSERSGMNLNVGFELSRRVGAITYLNTGLEYINNSYRAEFDFVNFRNANFNSSTGEIENYTLRKDPKRIAFSDVNSFHFLNLPMSVSYQPWANDHLRINLEFGFSLLYFLRAQGSTIDYQTLDLIDLNQRSYRKFMASSSLSVGIQYYISRSMNIGIEPTMMYFTNSIYTEEYPFEVIPYSMGVNFKLQMKLQ